MAKFYCRVCNVTMPTVWAKDSHYNSWRHIDMVQKQQQHYQPPEARTILVTNYFPRTSENQLGNYFSRFGRVVKVYFDRMSQANVEFSDVKEVSWAVNFSPHILNHKRLMVRAKAPLDNRGRGPPGGGYNKDRRQQQMGHYSDQQQNNMRTGMVIHSRLCWDLNRCQTLAEQLEECQDTLLLGKESHVSREKVKDDLQAMIREYLPSAKIAVYGSCLSGLALNKANLNLSITLEEGQSYYADWPPNFQEYYDLSRAPGLHMLQAAELMASDIAALPHIAQLSILSRLLTKGDFRRRNLSQYPTPGALTLTHQPSSLECVLTINQGHRIRYSELLALYVRYEPRLLTLVPAIAMWAKHHGLLNALPYPVFLMLVVYHLQTRGVLPTVETLRKLAGDQPLLINGVDCSFCEDLAKLPPQTNTQTCDELYKDFFSFYASYDFTLYMINPYSGKSIFKLGIDSLEDEATKKIKMGPLMIQDPFDHSKNLAENIKLGYLINLMEKFKVTNERVTTPEFGTKSENEKLFWGIPMIVMKTIPHVSTSVQQDYHKRYHPIEIILHMTLESLKYVAPTPEAAKELSLEELKELWYEKVPHAIIQYLNKGYLFECEVLIDRLKEKPALEEFVYGPVENGKSESLKRPLDENGDEEDPPAKKPCLDEEAKKEEESAKEEQPSEEQEKKSEEKKSEEKKSEEKKSEEKKSEEKKEESAEAAKAEAEKAAAAAKKKEEEDKNILFKGLFKVYYRTLIKRKQALSKITSEQEEVEYLEQEHLISEYLAKEGGKKPAVSTFEFEVTMRKVQHGALSTLVVTLSPKVYTGNFRFMAEMLQVRMSKIVEKILSKVKSKLNLPAIEEPASSKKEEADNNEGGDKKAEDQEEQELLKEDGDEGEEKIEEEYEAMLLKE